MLTLSNSGGGGGGRASPFYICALTKLISKLYYMECAFRTIKKNVYTVCRNLCRDQYLAVRKVSNLQLT